MSDMPIFAFILLGILLFAFAAISFFFFLYDHRDKYYRYEDDELVTGKDFFCEFRRFGGAENRQTCLKLIYAGGEKAKLYYSDTDESSLRKRKKAYDVPKEAVDRLKEIYQEHCIPVLADSPEMEEAAPDVPTESVCFAVAEDKESYLVSNRRELPEKSRGLFHEVEELLVSYVPQRHHKKSTRKE